jgi:TolA-binding protein
MAVGFHSFRMGWKSVKFFAMTKLRIPILLLLLALAGVRADAAIFGGGEKKAYDAAYQSFQFRMWESAASELADFTKDYPKSEKIPQVVVWQAEALYRQDKFDAVVTLLQPQLTNAGTLEDQYLYWIASAQMARTNYAEAAALFGKLGREFPTSGRRLEAAVGEAAAQFKMSDWAQVTNLLRRADGAFRQSLLSVTNSETVARGYLLLAESQLALGNYPDAEAALTNKRVTVLTGELEWKRRDLLCQVLVARKDYEAAARESAGLVAAAESTHQMGLMADSVLFRADLLERLGQRDEAVATLWLNLTNATVAQQRQALSRIVSIKVQQGKVADATQTLESYLDRNTNAPAADVAWLTLGELHLKQHVGRLATDTNEVPVNHLAVATNCFVKVVKNFPGNAYVGKAQLDLGWCYWVESNFVASEAAFDAAVKRLPMSEDLAVARFKLADAQFVQSNYVAALENYRRVLPLATNWPAVDAALRTPASYQALRSSLALKNDATGTNLVTAEEALRSILATDANNTAAASSLLLVGQAYVDAQQPTEARRLFDDFITRFPESELRPEVALLSARMREDEGNWADVVRSYEAWLNDFPTNQLRGQVEFRRALATARSGTETNALALFTNYIAQFPTNDWAPRAQWWVADYYFNRGAYAEAELQYKQLFQTWKTPDLAYPARMMAGRAAVAWSNYENATNHFTSLTSDPKCPAPLRVQALFAYGGVTMRTVATTNKFDLIEQARRVFNVIVTEYPTNELVAQAWGEIGNCSLQLGVADAANYVVASNAYQRAASWPGASVTTRSQALVGLAIVLEKQALLQPGSETMTNLLKQARDYDWDVYRGIHLAEGEWPDAYWRKRAGDEAARLSEFLGEWPQALELYRDMARSKLKPADQLEKKIDYVKKQLRSELKNN